VPNTNSIHVVREIKVRMADFQKRKIIHEGRKMNVDAHRLARRALGTDVGKHVWLQVPPDGVCNFAGWPCLGSGCNLKKNQKIQSELIMELTIMTSKRKFTYIKHTPYRRILFQRKG
jgi:hypothetical protein